MVEAGGIDSNQYLTFQLSDEVFGLAIGKVREVLDFDTVTKVPQTPEYMLGVINLRSSVVPVIDMRLKFGMDQVEQTVDTCIIVLEINVDGDSIVVGALADSVREVLDINPDQIEPPPRLGTRLNTEFINGMGKVDEQFMILLNIDRIFNSDELVLVQDATHVESNVVENELAEA